MRLNSPGLAALALLLALTTSLSSRAADPTKAEKKHPANRLAKESSSYLLQHAHNPVDWYPWGEEAFARAKKENKLVFLSVGYSSCHWCHVMERESFASEAIAKILNTHYVCIKVDREERPDIDDIYLTSLQLMGQGGGWPMTMFLTPDGKPIFGGTYFPPDDKEIDGRKITGMKTLLDAVQETWKDDPKRLLEQADKIARATSEYLVRSTSGITLAKLDAAAIKTGADSLLEIMDPLHGGFGRKRGGFEGSKFPMPPSLAFLWQQAKKSDGENLRVQVKLTLNKIADGGIYDHLGGGFHRYSTERTWSVPHFEKMLYDNAQLVELYAKVYSDDPNPRYREVITDTLAFIEREMTDPTGGFYSALDADSDGKEGAFYVWTRDELKSAFPNDADYTLFTAALGGHGSPNFEGNAYVLKRSRSFADVAADQKLTEAELRAKLAPLKAKLLEVRASRNRPFLDRKILTAWNGMMIAGYAEAGKVLKEPKYLDAARKAADFVLTKLRSADGRLARVWAIGENGTGSAKGVAFSEDYAFVIHGLLNLFSATGERRWLDEAKSLTETVKRWHTDDRAAGYYYTANDAEKLFARSKDYHDGVQPSANSQMAANLVRLWKLTDSEDYRKAADSTIRTFGYTIENNADQVPAMLAALDRLLSEPVLPTPPANAPKDLARDSAKVVKLAALAAKPADDGTITITATLTIDKPWHVYANPVKNKTLQPTETVVAVYQGGKKLDAKVTYPASKTVEDEFTGDYEIYEGTPTITITVKPTGTGPLEVRATVSACNERSCLKSSTLQVMLP
ncbi:DUF255 domain-containing protein [Tuwongella immobilis]|uniref:DUF255 domain-containing protein n=1 Tax=Tuwongella immobilis TaxID=692036 RepID=A0A6C2YRV9_9BACT|nr:DUF255 domain-containing protein [Tuwongella immobilis]VIP04398.1 thioredoxin domain-containing protein : Thioredoxin domain protein OS=Singulisphaera acidiphila (strain ATCC BAA-1392 / DSM 18658 / VKM B-2454 / MOB10) GN=Sinac_5043 PE=4 SV=1: Thioredox_DsbH: DsbC [Tuwongella immobilis]VTS06158.1 thioredoxin domain-containing protein : Thioredoxin domain protein OS=Singulisphaera acidiphila (strain ATCC BAA-1392 / DSM 18658 / VKM B-2454 / MOB10) GN=Sinac_5043 PE=4 SV=1: Thioredox_DsbH: DsbC [Tu